MKRRFAALGASLVALAVAPGTAIAASSANQSAANSASAGSFNGSTTTQNATQAQQAGSAGSGQAQQLDQSANTEQKSAALAVAKQDAVNANVPVSIAGKSVYGGSNQANQDLDNSADAKSANFANTEQNADQSQSSSSSCKLGCGGSGQFQALDQSANTEQESAALAVAKQDAVNANVPVSIAGKSVHGGSNQANQDLDNSADAKSANFANTEQNADQSQSSSSSCKLGCGGSGQFQALDQSANTEQESAALAVAKQDAVNANVPVSIAGKSVHGGSNQANQDLDNSADAKSANFANTEQNADQSQSSSSSCKLGCGGSGQFQALDQSANTEQESAALAVAKQDAVNANVPVSIAGKSVHGGSNQANQDLDNSADAKSANFANTEQNADQSQSSSSSCKLGCGGSGQFQALDQSANTEQESAALAVAKQDAVNANVPVSIAGKSVHGGSNQANQDLDNSADAKSANFANTEQNADQSQSSSSSCKLGCGGSGQFQALDQSANTEQESAALAVAKQDAVNANVPVSIAGKSVHGGSNQANQDLDNSADAKSANFANTEQNADQSQSSSSSCKLGCGGSGQFQALDQSANTEQESAALAVAKQDAVNANVPVSIAGKSVHGGSNQANQDLDNSADAKSANFANTEQNADQSQSSSSSCKLGCGGSGQFQALDQSANTEQESAALAVAKQDAVNANVPVSSGHSFKGHEPRKAKKHGKSGHSFKGHEPRKAKKYRTYSG